MLEYFDPAVPSRDELDRFGREVPDDEYQTKDFERVVALRCTPRVNFVGHSRYNHQFDFVVPKSKRAPERILLAINNPNKDNAQSAAFACVDTKDVRPADSLAFAMLNDRDHKVSEAVQDALRSYDITPIAWTKREEFKERLAA